MLSRQRIKEAEENVSEYLDDGLLIKLEKRDMNANKILAGNSKESFKVAQILFDNNHSDLWVIVCSYYSMYYIANAVLCKLGYKTSHKITHKITADALIVLVRNKLEQSLIADYEEARNDALGLEGTDTEEIIESFDKERINRNRIQYSTTELAKREKAKLSIERAKRFLFAMDKLLTS